MDEVKIEDLPQKEDKSPSPPSEGEKVEHLAISRHFDIDTPSKEENKKLSVIWEYAKTLSKTQDMQDVIWQTIHLSRSLGAPNLGESRLDKIYRWASLKRQEAEIQEELKRV